VARRIRGLERWAPFACLWLSAALGAGTAAAQQPTCVTRCEQKVDLCARQCEELGDAVYRDPASLRQCQLACAKQLFVACVQHCTETGEVVEDDYGLAAENPDHLPPAPEGGR
jgi:hypothetical protein